MNEETKKRISDINNGIIPDGYKKTKVGIVPVEWEVKKLNNYLYVNKEKNIEHKYSKDEVFSISGEFGIVNQIEFLGRSYAGVSVEPYRIVYPQNIVYTKSPLKANPYGIIKSNQTNTTGIVSTLYAVYYCKDNVLSKYIEYYFGLDATLNNYLLPLVNIGSKHDMKISDENVLTGLVLFPPLPEQQKIAEILSAQDKLISLQEKKIEKLKELKKAYLQKMFPKKGSKSPELRFKGFTDDWEQRKFDEVFISFVNKNYQLQSTKYCESGKYPIIDQGKKTIIGYSDNEDKVCNKYPSIIFGDHTTEIKYVDFPFIIGADGVKTLSVKNGNTLFQYYNLQVNNVQPTGYKRHFSMLKEISLYVPTLAEQQQIGSYFRNLDTLITLNQRKLEQEKQKKKALMQLLLTGKIRVS